MSNWIDACPLDALPTDTYQVVDIEGAPLALFNIGDQIYAIEDVCSHDGGELASGTLAGDILTCPRHGAQFSVKSGKVLGPPAYEDVHVFPVRIVQGIDQVRDDRWD